MLSKERNPGELTLKQLKQRNQEENLQRDSTPTVRGNQSRGWTSKIMRRAVTIYRYHESAKMSVGKAFSFEND